MVSKILNIVLNNQKGIKRKNCIILYIKKCVYNIGMNCWILKEKIAGAVCLRFLSDNKIHLL